MSGIAGFWNVDGAPVDRELLRRMSAAIRHRALDGGDEHVDGPCGVAHLHGWTTAQEIGERQPLVGRSGAVLVMDGRIDNRDELLGALNLPPSASDAACALAAFERWDDGFAERLAGEFALAIVEPARRRALLARDVIGVRPIYYFRGPRLFAFASEIKALLAHAGVPRRVNDEGLADYLMVGARPLDRQDVTCFEDIAAVVPAHVVVVTAERQTVRRYWDFDTARTLRLRSFDEYAEAFRGQFVRAVKRRTRGPHPVAVAVSGGLDSSSIFCQAETLRRTGGIDSARVHGISYVGAAGSDADEREYLQAIEGEYGVEIERFPLDPLTGLVSGADDQVRAVEAPFVDYLWNVTRELERRAAAGGARMLLSGHWGDQVLFSSAYLVDLFDRFAWRRIRQHTREYRRYFGTGEARVLLRRFFFDVARSHVPRAAVGPLKWLRRRLTGKHKPKQWFSDAFLAGALRFADRPATIGSNFHSAHARAIYLEARSKYHVQCMEWNNKIAALHGLDTSFPFLDRDLLALLMAVPGDIQTRDGVPRALLREAMRGVLPDVVRGRTWKADFSDVVDQGVAHDVGAIGRAMAADPLVVRFGYVDRARLAAEIPRLVDGLGDLQCTARWDLADLYGFERWLRVFLAERHP